MLSVTKRISTNVVEQSFGFLSIFFLLLSKYLRLPQKKLDVKWSLPLLTNDQNGFVVKVKSKGSFGQCSPTE